MVQNITGNFILGGLINVPFVYKVHIIRNGRSYSTRIVNVTQAHEKGICFTATCSFKLPESSPLDVQENVDLWSKYASVLQGKKPQDFEECPGMDLPFYHKLQKETGINDAFPGLTARKVDMTAYNKHKHPLDRRQLILYRTLGTLPSDPNMHLCAHLYASDRNSLYIVANHLEVGDIYTQMGSLTHKVVFHADATDLLFGPSRTISSPLDDQQGRYFCKEDSSDRVSGGRTLFHSKVYASNGTHVASIMQDGMIRLTKKSIPTAEELDVVRSRESRWQPREKL